MAGNGLVEESYICSRFVGGRLLYVPQADKPKYLYKVMAA